jgi:hypothetical protein
VRKVVHEFNNFLLFQVVSCSQYVTGEGSLDQKEFVWTLHKSKEEWEISS